MRNEVSSVLIGLSLILAEGASGQSDRSGAGSHVSWSVDSCLKCHVPSDSAELAARATRPCRDLCATCHELREKHHPVSVTIPRPVPAPLLLTKKGTNTCVTCHDLTRPRLASSPWVSQSLFAGVLRRSRENRTFYLAMPNSRGQLCRNCH